MNASRSLIATRLPWIISRAKFAQTVDASVDLYAACCLERFPVIQPQLTQLECDAKNMFRRMEMRSSLLSEHEVRHREDQALLKKRAKEAESDAAVAGFVESGPLITAVEAEDMWEAEKEKFSFAARQTEADAKNNTSSTHRSLDKKLVFVVEQKLGDQFQRALPQAKWQEGETLRQTAERALTDVLLNAYPPEPEGIESPFPPLVQFLGNAPVGVYKYRYPKALRNKLNRDSLAIFFFKAHLLDWQLGLQMSEDVEKYRNPQWLTREELCKCLHADYAKRVSSFLLDF